MFDTFGIRADWVWPEASGDGISIAFFDSGIQPNHPDLINNYDVANQLNAGTGAADGSPGQPFGAAQAHGTWMAGLAAASRNGGGVVGVAYDATIVSIRDGYVNAAPTYGAAATLAAWTHAAAFDVVNNSWGGAPLFSDDFRDPAGYGPAGDVQAAAAMTGRGGLGTVFVQVAANLRQWGDDVNLHSVANSPYSITVAGTDRDGEVASFSSPGAAVLVAAPAVDLATTDLTGDQGVPGTDYALVSGTSGSAALVSGVIALMLELNPSLGWRDVQEILALTARNTGVGATTTTWQTNGAHIWNGGGFRVSHDVGMGLVDAHAAVRLADWWPAMAQHTSTNELRVDASAFPNAAITDNRASGISSSVTITDAIVIDHVIVHLDITHPRINDLEVVLVSPSGTESRLVQRPSPGTQGTEPGGIDFVMSSTQSWGEDGQGDWTLIVKDREAGATGQLNSWSLILQGDQPTTDSLYVYTDDFTTVATPGSSRTQVVDNEGYDVLLAPSVTTPMVIDLRPGAASTIAGRTITIGSSTVIEEATAGDGNDSLTGNDADNRLNGGFGNDTIIGLAGNDTLFGNDGADYLVGGAGNDSYGVDSIGDVVMESADEGMDRIRSSVSYTLPAFVEILSLNGAEAREGYGNDLNNTLIGSTAKNALFGFGGNDSIQGGEGDDTIDGGAGRDTMVGGAGRDLFIVDDSADLVIESGGSDLDTVQGAVSFTLPSSVEMLVLTGSTAAAGTGNALANRMDGNSGDNQLEGRAGNDTINGNDGNDTLDGGSGIDRLSGGNGDDVFIVDNVSDFAFDTTGGGRDRVASSVSHALTGNIEDLTLLDGAVTGTGNGLANRIIGNSAANVLTGGGGGDAIITGGGDDTVFGDGGDDTLDGGGLADGRSSMVGGTGNDWAFGGNDADTLIGDAGNDSLNGGNGEDHLWGGDGSDDLYGELGNDTASGDEGNDVLLGNGGDDSLLGGNGADVADGGEGNDTLDGGAGDDTLIGGTGNDSLRGRTENDSLNGGAGNDTMIGDAGDDMLDAGSENDSVSAGGGNDSVDGGSGDDSVDGSLGNDWLFGGLGNDILFGSSGDDTLIGDGGNDTITGGDGNDTLNGGFDDDHLLGAEGDDTLVASDGNDSLDGGPGADSVVGGNGNDTLRGGAGSDRINGGSANDLLTGGAEDDTFLMTRLGDGNAETDTITDYSLADGDVIDLPDGAASILTSAAIAGGWKLTLRGDGDTLILQGVNDGAGDGILNDVLII